MAMMRSAAEVQADLDALVEHVRRTRERVVVALNGEPAAVLLSLDELESLEETLDVLSDPALMREIVVARAEAASGHTCSTSGLSGS